MGVAHWTEVALMDRPILNRSAAGISVGQRVMRIGRWGGQGFYSLRRRRDWTSAARRGNPAKNRPGCFRTRAVVPRQALAVTCRGRKVHPCGVARLSRRRDGGHPGSGPRAPRRAPRWRTCRPQARREPAAVSLDAASHDCSGAHSRGAPAAGGPRPGRAGDRGTHIGRGPGIARRSRSGAVRDRRSGAP